MLKQKKAQMQLGKKIEAGAVIVILVVVLFLIYAELVPEAQKAGDALNASNRCADVGCTWNVTTASVSGITADCATNSSPERTECIASAQELPLGNIFRGSGIVFLIIMVVLLITILKAVLPKGKK